MKTLVLTLVIALFSITNSFAQLPNETPQSKLENDIKNNKVTLYILGGIAARAYKGDAEFEKKYHVDFHDFGCLAPFNIEFYTEYNQLAFEYLNTQHGSGWQVEIRPDILGWEDWKKKK